MKPLLETIDRMHRLKIVWVFLPLCANSLKWTTCMRTKTKAKEVHKFSYYKSLFGNAVYQLKLLLTISVWLYSQVTMIFQCPHCTDQFSSMEAFRFHLNTDAAEVTGAPMFKSSHPSSPSAPTTLFLLRSPLCSLLSLLDFLLPLVQHCSFSETTVTTPTVSLQKSITTSILTSGTNHFDVNTMDWWSDNKQNFPATAMGARCILSISATLVQSERLFWATGRLISKLHSWLLHDTAEMLVFLNKNNGQN